MSAEIATFFEYFAAVQEWTSEAPIELSSVLELQTDNRVVLVHIVVIAFGIFERPGGVHKELFFCFFVFK